MLRLSSRLKKKLALGVVCLGVFGAAGFFVLTSPWMWSLTHPTRDVADNGPANLENGKEMFVAGDCSTCHATPGQTNPLILGGGRALDTAFGVFHMPNISPDPEDGIGNWTLAEFTKAVREGVGPGGMMPDGQNLYPSFPYTSYQRMTANDVRDMFAYIQSLEPVKGKAPGHELKFPFNIRRGVGVWRLAFLDGKPLAMDTTATTPAVEIAAHQDLFTRGQYLVEGPGHCAECHSLRTFMGNIPVDLRYGGGPTPEGKGYFPNISPDETGIGFWSANSIANYLKTGISPINKKAGGDMEEVVANTSQLSDADRLAMAYYLKKVAPVDKPAPGVPEPNRTTEVVMLERAIKKTVVLPTSNASAIATSDEVYIVHTKPFYLDKSKIGVQGAEDGKFLGAAKLDVINRAGNLIEVRLNGWQLAGAHSVFYAEHGQRIMQAILGDAAIAQVKRGQIVVDPGTQQEWAQSDLTAWIDTEGLNTELPALWSYSSDLFNTACSTCHVLPQSHHFLANQWIGNLNAMKRFTSLTDDQYRLLLAYLQNHSKDVGAEKDAP